MVPAFKIAPPCTHATSRCAHASHQPVIGLGIMENVYYKVRLRASVSAIYRHLPWTITSSHHPTSHFLHLSLHQTSRRSFSLHNTTQHNTTQRNATHPPPPPPHPTHVHDHSPPFHLPHLALRLTSCANTRTDHRSQITDPHAHHSVGRR